MPLLEKELLHCEQCGAPLESGSTALGCLNCLLLGGLNKPSAECRRYQHYEVCLRDDGALYELGRGAMGITYRAMDINLDSPVALKVISGRFSENPEARERFRREARAAAKLRHANVASVFHFGETAAGQCFYAMELVEGETLEARVRREGPLPPRLVLEIAIQVARALIAAEAHGLVHRDLKPSNLMVLAQESSDTDALLVKVIDFGLARAMAAAQSALDQTHAGFSGTPEFASPEQFGTGATPLDIRSDIYSLGATLWYLLCGNAPFPGRTLAKRPDQPLPLEQLTAAKVPAPVVGVLRSMLATSPVERPQSARELLTALRRCRELLEATPRRRRLQHLAALVIAVGVLVVGLTSYLLHRQHATPASVMPAKSIVVLPFQNLSTEPENAFFAGGMQDEVLTELAKIAELKVISRTSAAHYKTGVDRNMREIARDLGVAYVVEGTAQRAGDHIRVSAQLIDARTDTHLWAEHYDRQVADVFAIQSEIAQQIASQLHARLSPAEKAAIAEQPTPDLIAYALYTEARALGWGKLGWGNWDGAEKSFARKLELLNEATQRDPNFALAYCALAQTQDDLYDLTGDRTHLDLAKHAVDTALRLRPDLGETNLELARYHLYAGEFDRAHDELAIARRTLPNNSDAIFMAGRIDRRRNRWDDSLANLQKASELDPRNTEIDYHLKRTYRQMRRYADWEQRFAQESDPDPAQNFWIKLERAELKLDEGNPVAAQSLLARVPLNFSPTMEVWDIRFTTALYLRDYDAASRVIAAIPAKFTDDVLGGQPPESWADGLVARLRGDKQKAETVFAAARRRVDATWGDKNKNEEYFALVARCDAGLDRKEEAIREAQRAVDLLPITKDSWLGPALVTNLAMIYAWTGEPERAFEQLGIVTKIPAGPSYGDLRFNPCWDSLRGDPRFEKIVASLVPKSVP